MQRSEKEQDWIDDEVPCFVTKGSRSGNKAQSEHLEVAIAFWGSSEAEVRTKHKPSGLYWIERKSSLHRSLSHWRSFYELKKEVRFCREQSLSVCKPYFCYDYHGNEILVQKTKLCGASQSVVLKRLRQRLLRKTEHYPVLAGHSGRTPINSTLSR